MGSCCSQKNQDPRKFESPPAPPTAKNTANIEEPASQPSPVPALKSVPVMYKPRSKSRTVLAFSKDENKAFELQCSVPFQFHENSGICSIGPDSFFIAGGLEYDQDEFTDECMLLETSLLTAARKSSLPKPTAAQTLLYCEDQGVVYAVGGLQKRGLDESVSEIGECIVGQFALFDLQRNEWRRLPAMPLRDHCCPTCYMLESKIYAAGGFVCDSEYTPVTDMQVYDIHNDEWSISSLKFSVPVIGAVARPLQSGTILMLGGLLNNPITSKAFLYYNSSYETLKEFDIPNLQLSNTTSMNAHDQIHFMVDPDHVIVFDCHKRSISDYSVRSLIDSETQATDKLIRRQAGIYAYHLDQPNRTLYEFNTYSFEKTTEVLHSVQARDGGVTLLKDGRILLAGGVGISSAETTAACLLFNPLTNAEERPVKSLPKAVRGLRLIATATHVYAIAGFDPDAEDFEEVHCFIFKLDSHEWVPMKTLCYRVRYPSVSLIGNSIYAIGGEEVSENGVEEVKSYVQVYDLKQNLWILKDFTYPLMCKNMGSCTLNQTRSLIFGGESEDGDCVLDSYMFDGESFEKVGELPDDSALTHFNDPPCVGTTCVYAFSSCGELYCFDMLNQTWRLEELEEMTNNQV